MKFFRLLLVFFSITISLCAQNMDGTGPSLTRMGPLQQNQVSWYPSISPPLGWLGDITFEDTLMWVGGPTGYIFKISPTTGQVLDSMDTHLNVAIDGITYGNHYLWVAQSYLGHTILKIDPVTKTIVATLTHPVPSSFTHGMEFHNNQLWINMFWTGTTDTTFVLDTLMNIVNRFPNYCLYSHGIAFDGSNFWITSNFQPPNNSNFIYKFDSNFTPY